MKKVILTLSTLGLLFALLGADIRRNESQAKPQPVKKFCNGYTIIEFGKGINCDGDTVRLTKVKGGQELLRSERIASY